MLQFLTISSLLASALAYGSYGGSYGGARRAISGGCGFGGCGGGFGARGFSSGFSGGIIPAAVQTRHRINYVNVPSGGYVEPVAVEIGASAIPINMVFHSRSSDLNVRQQHISSQGSFQETSSQDEPHVLRHTVTKPILQEIREVVTPFRRITQEIRPVQENINTIVARGVNVNGGAAISGVSGISGVQSISGGRRFAVRSGNGFTGSANFGSNQLFINGNKFH